MPQLVKEFFSDIKRYEREEYDQNMTILRLYQNIYFNSNVLRTLIAPDIAFVSNKTARLQASKIANYSRKQRIIAKTSVKSCIKICQKIPKFLIIIFACPG